jgi:hypothetical protein
VTVTPAGAVTVGAVGSGFTVTDVEPPEEVHIPTVAVTK